MNLLNRTATIIRHSIMRFLRGYRPLEHTFNFASLTPTFVHARFIVRAFYVLLCFFVFNNIVANGLTWLKLTNLQPLWPLYWVPYIDLTAAIYAIMAMAVGLTLLCLVYYEHRLARIGAFFGFLQLTALLNSFGKINHGFHGWVVIAFIFIFLPHKGWEQSHYSVNFKQRFLFVFATAQTIFMTFYSMSGAWKIYAGLVQMQAGLTYHTFHPHAMAQQIASRLIQTNSESILGPLIIQYPWLGTLPYLVAVYLEATAVIAVFRPPLHKFLGIAFSIFHFSTWLTMSIYFNTNILLLGLFFVLSPFTPAHVSLKTFLYNLPLWGDLWRLINQKRRVKELSPRTRPTA